VHDVDLRRRHNHVAGTVTSASPEQQGTARRGEWGWGREGGGAKHGRGRSPHVLVGAAAVPDGTCGDGRCRRGAAAAWSVERRCVNLRRPRAPSVGGGFFCSRRLPPRNSNTLRCSRAGSCSSTRRCLSVCCFQRTRRWESTKAAPLPCKSPPPIRNSAASPKVHFQAPCGAMGAGQRSAQANHCARGWGGCPASLQSMARTSPNKNLCAPICTTTAAIK